MFHDEQPVLSEQLFVEVFHMCDYVDEGVLTVFESQLTSDDLLFEVLRYWCVHETHLVHDLQWWR